MKKKEGFVTNSSSASFIVTIFSSYDDLTYFKEYMKGFITQQYLENVKYMMTDEEFKHESMRLTTIIETIRHIGPNTFEIADFTTMLNDVSEDLPKWIIRVLISKALGETYPFIKEVTLRVDED